jgi:sugar lactone lactonase YvrE
MENSMTRRTFLTATAAAAVGPILLRAQDKAGTKLPIAGTGEHTYEMIHDWGQLPSHIKYGNTHSVVEDSHGFIYVHHTVHATSQSGDAVVVFDDKGKFVRSFGSMFRNGAHGMHLQKEGRDEFLYFCDEKHGIVTKRTLKGEEVWTRGYPQESSPYEKGPGKPGLNYRPTNIAIATNGDFWVADGYGSYYVHHYDKNAKLLNTFGGPPPGSAPGRGGPGREGRGEGRGQGAAQAAAAQSQAQTPQTQAQTQGEAAAPGRGRGTGPVPAPIENMNNPHGIWLDERDASKPVLLVADRGNRRIVRYTIDDKPIDIVEGTLAPCHFHTQKGVMVVPDLQCRVTLYDKDNKVITHLGDGAYAGRQNQLRVATDRSQFEPGKFITPHGAWFDHAGNIFVGEWVEIGRLTKLRRVSA